MSRIKAEELSGNAVPAVYDPNRTSDGKFVKGNKAGIGWQGRAVRQWKEVQRLWFTCISEEDVERMYARIVELALQGENLDVALKATVYWTDRTFGKPTERVEVSPGEPQTEYIQPTEEELAVLQKLIRRTSAEAAT